MASAPSSFIPDSGVANEEPEANPSAAKSMGSASEQTSLSGVWRKCSNPYSNDVRYDALTALCCCLCLPSANSSIIF